MFKIIRGEYIRMSDNTTPQESWNMATETLKRLSRCLDLCSFFSQNGRLFEWFNASMDLRRNLYPFLTDTEWKAIDDKIKELPKGWVIKGNVMAKHYGKVHKTLDELYLLFISNMKSKGILMPKPIDATQAVLQT